MSRYVETAPTLTRVASSGGYVAEALDGTASAGATAQAALSGLMVKQARREGVFPRPGDCPYCYGDGHFEVRLITNHLNGVREIAGTRPLLIECEACDGSGLDPVQVAAGHELHDGTEREAREWIEATR